MRLDPPTFGLADFDEEIGEPALVDIEGLTAFDTGKGDRAHDIAVVFVETGDTTDPLKSGLGSLGTAGFDELEIVFIGRGAAGEVTALLHEEFLGSELFLELIGEPLANVDRVETVVAEGVLGRLLRLR